MNGSATTHRETERKYETGDAGAPVDPGAILGLENGAHPDEQALEAVYFDTPNLDLLRAGVTLRRRQGGHDEGWHLKLPAGGDSRDEVALPLTRARRTPPAELVALTRLHSRGGRLAPVAQLNTRRRRWVLADSAGRELVELVEDEVEARTMGAHTSTVSWHEIEVELGEHGPLKLLDRIERKLLKAGARRSGSSSKLRRVLGDRLPSTDGGATSNGARPGSAGRAVLDYLEAQAEQLRTHDPLVRQDAPDAVHQMRVAARRMRSALQAYRRILDRDATAPLVEELRWLGRELNDARDSEIIEQRLHAVLDTLPEELVLGPVGAQVTHVLQRRRAEGQRAAIAALDSDRYLALHDAIDRLLAEPPLTRRAVRPAGGELPEAVAEAWQRTTTRMGAAQRATGAERDLALHETRKAAKRLRYAVEVAAPSTGKPAERLQGQLKELHTVLGEVQDGVVTRPVVRELATQAQAEGGSGFTYGLLHCRESMRTDQAERDLPDAWKRLRKSKNIRWFEL